LQKGLRVFVRDEKPLEAIVKRLAQPAAGAARAGAVKSEGEVNMVLLLGGGTEVEVKLPGRFAVSPQIAGALKAVPGVVEVQAV
jgi:DNA polymerase-3 subunit alpha